MNNRFFIDIELYPTGEPLPDPTALQRAVSESLAGWWPAMGLTGEPAVQVLVAPAPAALFDFVIRFDGQPVPVPVYQAGQARAPLHFRILLALLANRTRFITAEQLRQLRRQCIPDGQTPAAWHSAPLSVWQALAGRLLANGFSLNRLPQGLANWTPEKTADETFEALVENPETLQLCLELSPELTAAAGDAYPDWDALLPGFYNEVFQDRGILLPQIVVHTVDGLATGQFRLRLNDLWMPVLPGPQAGKALYKTDNPAAGYYLPAQNAYYSTEPGDDVLRTPDFSGSRAYILEWIRNWTGHFAAWYVCSGIAEGLLDNLEETNRSLIVMIREQWPTHRLCAVLRRLLDEQVSVRNLPEILDVLLRVEGPLPVEETEYLLYFPPASRVATIAPGVLPGHELSVEQWTSQVRASLKFPVVFPYLRDGVLPCYNLSPPLLRDLRDGFFQHAQPLPGSAFYTLLAHIRDLLAADLTHPPVLLAPTGIRPALAAALRPYFPRLAVLGHEELPPFFVPRVIDTIK